MVMRRVLALLLILGSGLAGFETVWGEVRDGAIHHEDATVAAAHSVTSSGDHGHEDFSAPEHDHDEQHQHGTSADHCTHQHGVAKPATISFDIVAAVVADPGTAGATSIDRFPSGFFHPPRA